MQRRVFMGILAARQFLEAPFQAKVFRMRGDLKGHVYETDRLEGLLLPDQLKGGHIVF